MKMNNFIDLFSGAGGFLRGFMDAGLKPEFSVEVWEPAIQTHKRNYPDVPVWDRDIRTIKDSELESYKGKVDIIIGGPPCQGFSTIGKLGIHFQRHIYLTFMGRHRSLRRSIQSKKNRHLNLQSLCGLKRQRKQGTFSRQSGEMESLILRSRLWMM